MYWAIYLSNHKNVLKKHIPIFSVLSVLPVVSSVSWESHSISTHYNEMWSGGLCCTVQYEKGFIGTIPIWIFHSYTGVHNPYLHLCMGTQGRNYDTYLGLGMRYEDEIFTILISMNETFKWCPFYCRLNFDPKLWNCGCVCDFWQKYYRHQKSLLGHHLKALLMLITMVQSSASYLIHTARYSALKTSSDLPDIHVIWCFRSKMVLQFRLKQP